MSLDLVGLPPKGAELDRSEADAKARGDNAYEETVERLLASAHFGERMTMDWLDAARYADTHGFNNDSARSMWRWRDWVIQAVNLNVPYDRFILEQLAGDGAARPGSSPAPGLPRRLGGGGAARPTGSELRDLWRTGGLTSDHCRIRVFADADFEFVG